MFQSMYYSLETEWHDKENIAVLGFEVASEFVSFPIYANLCYSNNANTFWEWDWFVMLTNFAARISYSISWTDPFVYILAFREIIVQGFFYSVHRKKNESHALFAIVLQKKIIKKIFERKMRLLNRQIYVYTTGITIHA